MLRTRLANVMNTKKKRGAVLFGAIGAITISICLLVGFNFNPQKSLADTGSNQIDHIPNIQNAVRDIPVTIPSVTPPSASPAKDHKTLAELKALVYSEPKQYEREFTGISALEITSVTDHIKITQGGDKLKIRYYEWMDNAYILSTDNGKLSLINNVPALRNALSDAFWSDNLGWLFEDLQREKKVKTIEITIPASMSMDSVFIDTIASVDVNGCAFDGEVEVEASSGRIKFENCTIGGKTNIDIGSGDIMFNGSHLNGEVSFDAGSGIITVNNSTFRDRTSMNVGSGNVNALNSTFVGKVSLNAGSGQLNMENCVHGEQTSLSVTSGGGTVKLSDSIRHYDIRFSTVSGKLSYDGNIVDDNALRNKDSTKRISLSSVSGSFNVTSP